MSFLKRTIKNAVSQGISRGIGNAIGKAVQQAVEPKATEYANKAASHFDQAAGSAAKQTQQTASGMEGAFANLERSMQGYATQMSRNVKVCPECGKPTTAEKKFCPNCGAKLPEETLAQSAVCPACGKQNDIGVKFCVDCGTKLPLAVQEEEMAARKNAAVMQTWDEKLAVYPKWSCGGTDLSIEEYEPGIYGFSAGFNGSSAAAQRAVEQYRQVLLQSGFQQAGRHPGVEHLYKRVNGTVYHVDTEHCFDGDPDCVCIGFDPSEPDGGFDYVQPETGGGMDFGTLKDLKNIFKL